MKFAYEKFGDDRSKVMTQEELARSSGVSLSVIKNLESGRRKVKENDEVLETLCDILNLSSHNYFVRDCTVISVFSNKGGSGKSTICANLSYALAKEYKKKVLLIDSDQQSNVTKNCGLLQHPYIETKNLAQAFIRQESIKNHIIPSEYEGLDIVPSHYDIGKIEPKLPTMTYKEQKFKNILEEIKSEGAYDFIIVDTNPTLSLWNNIILCASDYAIIPLECSPFGFGGIENIIDYIEETQREAYVGDKHRLEIMGIVISKFDGRIKMCKSIADVAYKMFEKEKWMFNTIIPHDASIIKSQNVEKPVGVNFPKSNVYVAFKKFAEEVIKRAQI